MGTGTWSHWSQLRSLEDSRSQRATAQSTSVWTNLTTTWVHVIPCSFEINSNRLEEANLPRLFTSKKNVPGATCMIAKGCANIFWGEKSLSASIKMHLKVKGLLGTGRNFTPMKCLCLRISSNRAKEEGKERGWEAPKFSEMDCQDGCSAMFLSCEINFLYAH